MQTPIQLIAGLGNPGIDYEATRHNAGAWFVEQLADDIDTSFKSDTKFKAKISRFSMHDRECMLLLPTTFMNLSGQAVSTAMRYYKIPPQALLVAHDDLDLPVGCVRLKYEGGHGGHNGLRNIIEQISSRQFYRLRLGIGHPGAAKHVLNYVLKRPNRQDKALIEQAINDAITVLPEILNGDMQKAMKVLHTIK